MADVINLVTKKSETTPPPDDYRLQVIKDLYVGLVLHRTNNANELAAQAIALADTLLSHLRR